MYKMEKIAIITSGYLPIPSVKGGGVEVLVDNLILQNESSQKVEFSVFSCYDPDADQLSSEYEKSKFVYVKTNLMIKLIDKYIYFVASKILKKSKPYSYRYIFQRIAYIFRVSNLLSKSNYDKVIIENNVFLLTALKRKKNYKKYNGKYYLHLHNEILNDFNNYSILESASKILCVSDYLRSITSKKFKQINRNKFDVVLNGIDLNRFRIIDSVKIINSLRQKFMVKESDFVFLYTGRIAEEKGILELLNAFSKIDDPNTKLLIVGSSFFGTNVKSDFERKVEQVANKMKERIIFTGYISNDKLYEIYNVADISVLPSVWGEPAGLTMIESICSGTPVVTTNSGGIPEYVDSKCSIVLENNNQLTNNLLQTMEFLISNKEVVKNMKENTIEVREKYGVFAYYNNFIHSIND